MLGLLICASKYVMVIMLTSYSHRIVNDNGLADCPLPGYWRQDQGHATDQCPGQPDAQLVQ